MNLEVTAKPNKMTRWVPSHCTTTLGTSSKRGTILIHIMVNIRTMTLKEHALKVVRDLDPDISSLPIDLQEDLQIPNFGTVLITTDDKKVTTITGNNINEQILLNVKDSVTVFLPQSKNERLVTWFVNSGKIA